MSVEYLSIVLDFLVLGFLGATIYYALKLSKSLNNFRAYRKEFNTLIGELGRNIEEAHTVIERMKDSGHKSGTDLESVLKESKLLADELQFINEAGNALASRLEGLAEKNRRNAQGTEEGAREDYDEQLYKHVEQMERVASPSPKAADDTFMIHDREFGAADNRMDDAKPVGLKSQAEQELFDAIQRNKKHAAH